MSDDRKERADNGQFLPGNSGRPPGALNKASTTDREFCRSILEDERYRENLRQRAWKGELTSIETMLLRYYAYGKPKDTLKIEGEGGRPSRIVIFGQLTDPLAEPDEPQRHVPALPPSQMADELTFNMEDFEEREK